MLRFCCEVLMATAFAFLKSGTIRSATNNLGGLRALRAPKHCHMGTGSGTGFQWVVGCEARACR